MDQVLNDRPRLHEKLERIAAALAGGIILVDAQGRVAWIDERTRQRLDGQLEALKALPLPLADRDEITVDCTMSAVALTVDGDRSLVCVLRPAPDQGESESDIASAIEAVMSDTSWLARTIIEKLKALRQVRLPGPRSSDLDLLTEREREVLALICEGRSDAEMGEMLNLSQNTVRNHVASLYRKIGVNRRSAAVIWARERAITSHEALIARGRKRPRPDGQDGR